MSLLHVHNNLDHYPLMGYNLLLAIHSGYLVLCTNLDFQIDIAQYTQVKNTH